MQPFLPETISSFKFGEYLTWIWADWIPLVDHGPSWGTAKTSWLRFCSQISMISSFPHNCVDKSHEICGGMPQLWPAQIGVYTVWYTQNYFWVFHKLVGSMYCFFLNRALQFKGGTLSQKKWRRVMMSKMSEPLQVLGDGPRVQAWRAVFQCEGQKLRVRDLLAVAQPHPVVAIPDAETMSRCVSDHQLCKVPVATLSRNLQPFHFAMRCPVWLHVNFGCVAQRFALRYFFT